MLTQKTKESLSVAGLIYCALLLGTHYVITKQLTQTTDAVVLTGYRFLIAAIPLFVYLLFIRKNPFKKMKPGLILGFFLGLAFISIAEGVRYTSASNAGFISGIFIIFVPIFSFLFFRKKSKLYYLWVLALSLLGFYFLTGQMHDITVGDLLILASAIFTAAHLVLMGHYAKQDLDARVLCFQQFFVVFVLSFAFALVTHTSMAAPTDQVAPLLVLGLAATLSVFFVQMISLRYASEITAALTLAIRPVFAAIFAVAWAGESITVLQMIGGSLLIGAMVVGQFLPGFFRKHHLQEDIA